MSDLVFTKDDIADETIEYIDKYFKTVIINAKREYFRKEQRHQKFGISFVPLDESENNLTIQEMGYEHAICEFLEINGVQIPVYDPALAYSLKKLTHSQRSVLLQNVVLKIPLDTIAKNLGICPRMASKHKHNAIEVVKRSLKSYEE